MNTDDLKQIKDTPNEKKPGRGRPSKAQKQREEEEAARRLADEQQRKAVGEWGPVAKMALVSISRIIDSQFPGCGWEASEIDSVIEPLSRRLNAMFPDGGDNSDWLAVGMGLGIPLAARIQVYSKKAKTHKPHENGVAMNTDEK